MADETHYNILGERTPISDEQPPEVLDEPVVDTIGDYGVVLYDGRELTYAELADLLEELAADETIKRRLAGRGVEASEVTAAFETAAGIFGFLV